MAGERNVICQRIVNNIEALRRERGRLDSSLPFLRGQFELLQAKLAQAEAKLRELDASAPSRSLPRRLMPPIGSLGISVGEAVMRENAKARIEGRIDGFRNQIRQVRGRIEDTERQIQGKTQLIWQSQRDYSRQDCFSLGFSHEVLNVN